MSFYQNYLRKCNEKGISPSLAAQKAGTTKTSVTRWKNGSIPSDATIQKLAEFFGCDPQDLLGEVGQMPRDDAIAVRERLRSSPELKILFDATEDAPASALLEAAALIMRYKEQSK